MTISLTFPDVSILTDMNMSRKKMNSPCSIIYDEKNYSESKEKSETSSFGWLNTVCAEVASMVKDFLHGGIHLVE